MALLVGGPFCFGGSVRQSSRETDAGSQAACPHRVGEHCRVALGQGYVNVTPPPAMGEREMRFPCLLLGTETSKQPPRWISQCSGDAFSGAAREGPEIPAL